MSSDLGPDDEPPADLTNYELENFEDFETSSADLFDKSRDTKVHVQKIHYIGLDKTRMSVVQPEMRPLESAQTVEEMMIALGECHDNLMDLNVFNAVSIELKESDLVC